MGRGGYFERYLRVDLGRPSAEHVPLDEATRRAVVGGVGLGALLLTRETPPCFDPLGPEAALVLAFGPLVGTPLTTSAKLAFVAKSPLTGRISDGLSSSSFAIAGKRAGLDAIVIVGEAAEPSIVLVDEEGAEVVPCPELWGRDFSISEASERLGKAYPSHRFAVIGVAGERLVRYAGIANEGRHAGRGGLGAVLGAKRVKAIGVRGSRPVPLADAETTLRIAKDLARRSLGPATEKYRSLGTVANLSTFNRLAALPTRNFQASTFEEARKIEGEVLHETRERGRGSCKSCTIGCEHFFEVRPGERPVKMEYENLFALGPLCGIGDPEVVLRASSACDELGIDTISAGGTIAFAMECAERGLFPEGMLAEEARDLRFGAGERMLVLLEDIARRRTPLGDLLAEGSRRAAEIVGGEAPSFAPHVKGLEIPGYEPRALQTMALGFAVGTRGADHNRSGAYEADFSGKVNRFEASEESAAHAVAAEDRAAVMDALILCKFLRRAMEDFFGESAEMLRAVTGLPFEAEDLVRAAGRITLVRRLFNEREGWTPAEDTLPARFFEEKLPGGAAKGAGIDREGFARSIKAYHARRGLDERGFVPAEVARDMASLIGGKNR
ncbi:aldehyde ferredoxin oxidoreductase family protein [Polyangium jinanense]|uniref:Aldehyde ferredoxin oxidoreductase family protein n=1 Tax=Polyangium jinanense TaxID=2829994 RepID=A0A9X3XFI9_9BACT|nr:aldehyde ferredoxin oxidoreductase family protein [Polyangium jinanense]MDC3962315.1 aldehyde ferredoxin oxidoreductase family protein [Polyangium jinanense]MDC3989112.1 aldehyde ferredoxin oxidoreductase family protein [Polyangium jinanense]